MGRRAFHRDAAHLELGVPGGSLPHFKSHVNQFCLVQNSFVEGEVAVQGCVKSNGDVLDVVESHGCGHLDRGHLPPVLLRVPSAVLEIVCAFALGCLASLCVCQLKTVHGRDEVSQGFAGVNALFTSRPETGPKHRCFAII